MCTNVFLFGERILQDFDPRDVRLFNSMARPIKLRQNNFFPFKWLPRVLKYLPQLARLTLN